MNILGINFGHDSSATLIQQGSIKLSIEEEKISRVKQDFGWPVNAIKDILKQAQINKTDIDVVAIGGFVYNDLGANEIKYRFDKSKGNKQMEYASRVLAYIGLNGDRFSKKNKTTFETCVNEAGFTNAKVVFYNHHLCHAAGAFYCSPFTADLVITCDGLGDAESFNFYIANSKTSLQPIVINGQEVSVGAFYSAITEILGFRPTRHEGKITGLAAYGKPSNLEKAFMDFFIYKDDKLTRYPFDNVDELWNKYKLDSTLSLTTKINLETSESSIGTNYTKRYEILKARIKELSAGMSKEDIAYACQKVAEQVVVNETRRVIKKHFNSQTIGIALAGGVFANVRINQMLYEMPEVNNIFVQPAMGDSGLAIGAAILAGIEINKEDPSQYRFTNTYIGPNYDNQVKAFTETITHEATVVKMQQPAKEIAQMMKDNLVVGFWQGSMEWGPRALGKRSMILNTFDKSVNDSVNKRLSRTEFMPFAPSIIDYMMNTYIPSYDPNCPAADYMTITYDVAQEHHEELQAVVHVDGTARPQTVRKETNPYYYEIIDEFYRLTGCGAIVNTSFNAHEEPIVSSPQSAYKALKEDRIDVLVLNEYKIIIKK